MTIIKEVESGLFSYHNKEFSYMANGTHYSKKNPGSSGDHPTAKKKKKAKNKKQKKANMEIILIINSRRSFKGHNLGWPRLLKFRVNKFLNHFKMVSNLLQLV